MLSYNEMIKCEQKYEYELKQNSITIYKAFIEYLKKVINITFEDNKEQIASYLKETTDQFILLDWWVGDDHYDGFTISITKDEMLNIDSLIARDIYYDPELLLESDDDKIFQFFDKEYEYFMKLFVPCYRLSDLYNVNKHGIDKSKSLICKIANEFNKKCFKEFKKHFVSFGIYDEFSFIESKFSLSFTDEKRSELDKEVFDLYNSYHKKVIELTKKFDESVKDLK